MGFRISIVRILFYVSLPLRMMSQEAPKSELKFHHIVLFVSDSSVEKNLLENLFTSAEKLTTKHPKQGTVGRYILFYNTDIEFLYMTDPAVAEENEKRFKSAYTNRWDTTQSRCPISFGLILSPFDTTQRDDFTAYHSLDARNGEYYLMSKFNNDLMQPMVYASPPSRTYKKIDSLKDIDKKPEHIREDLRNYLTHSSGIKKLTRIILTLPVDELKGNTKLLNQLQEVKVQKGKNYELTFIFDNQEQKKEHVVEGDIRISVKY